MTLRSFVLTLACVVMVAMGQLLFKAAAGQWRIEGWSWVTVRTLLSPVMIAALFVYGGATLLWVFVLRSVPLSLAYSVFSLAFVIVPLMARATLGEPLSMNTIVGGAVIVAGVLISVR